MLFLIASVAVPLIGNGLRCVGIILLAHFTNNEYGAGADHIVYGWGFNVAILLVLIVRRLAVPRRMLTKSPRLATIRRQIRRICPAAVTAADGAPDLRRSRFGLWRDQAARSQIKITAITSCLQSAGWQEGNRVGPWLPYFPGADAQVSDESSPIPARLRSTCLSVITPVRARGHTMTAHLNLPWNERAGSPAAPRMATPNWAGNRSFSRMA